MISFIILIKFGLKKFNWFERKCNKRECFPIYLRLFLPELTEHLPLAYHQRGFRKYHGTTATIMGDSTAKI